MNCRLLLRLILYPFALALLCILSLLLIFRLPQVREWAAEKFTQEIQAQTGWKIEIEELDGFLPFHLHAKRLKLHKDQVAHMEAEGADVALSPLGLLKGKLALGFLALEAPTITLLSGVQEKKESASSLPNIELPDPFQIDHFRIRDLTWKRERTPPSSPLTLQGSIYLNANDNYAKAHVALSSSSNLKSPTKLSIEIFPEEKHLSVLLELNDAPQGLILSNFPLPFHPNISVKAAAEIPLPACFSLAKGKLPPKESPCQISLEIFSELNNELALGSAWLEADLEVAENLGIFSQNLNGKLILPQLPQQPILFSGNYQVDKKFDRNKGTITVEPFELNDSISNLSGALFGELTINGPFSSPGGSITLESPFLLVGSLPIEGGLTQLVWKWDGDRCNGNWLLSGTTEGEEINGNGILSLNPKKELSIQNFFLHLPFGKMEGAITYSSHILGNIHVECSKEIPELPIRIEEGASIDANFSEGSSKEQLLSLNWDGRGILGRNWKLGRIQGTANFTDPFHSPAGLLTLSLAGVKAHPFIFDELSLSTEIKEGTPSPFNILGRASLERETSLTASGEWQASTKSFALTLDTLEGIVSEYPLQMEGEWRLEQTKKQWIISPLHIALGNGYLETAGTLSHDFLKGRIYGVGLPLDLISRIVDAELSISGVGDLICNFSGSPSNVLGTLELSVEELKLEEEAFSSIPPVNGELKAKLGQDQISFSSEIITDKELPIQLDCNLPLSLTLFPLNLSLEKEAPLSCDVQFQGEITPLLQLFITDTTSLSGELNANFSLEGSAKAPLLNGRMTLKNGVYESLDSGAMFRNISADLIGRENTLLLTNMSAEDSKSGTLFAKGSIQLDPEKEFPFDLSMDLKGAELIHRDYAEATASGKLNLTGNLSKGSVEGNLTVDEAAITIPKDIPAQLRSVEVKYVNFKKGQLSFSKRGTHKKWPVELSVELNIPGKAFVRGRELNSEWEGHLSLKGSTKTPELFGTMQVRRGTIQFNGKEFNAKEGTIQFAGNPKTKITLYIVAEKQFDDLRAKAILKGPIKNPELSFASSPPLSEKEILSWILFNRPPSEISPVQGEELRETVFTVSSGRENKDVLSQIRRAIGIDRLDISSQDSDEENEVTVRVGKYLSRGVYVSVSKNITSEVNQVAIEAQVIRNIKVEGEVGDNAEGKVSLKWEKDY